nr:hypothetical protein [uncultured Carboxylicivirga sp.]
MTKNIEQFSIKKQEWNSLTKHILENEFVNSNLGKGIYPHDLENKLSTELINKGISFITVSNNHECKQVEYATKWTKYPIGTLYLTWTTCDSTKTKKGFYQSDSGFIEIYGIGNNWLIWVDIDFI